MNNGSISIPTPSSFTNSYNVTTRAIVNKLYIKTTETIYFQIHSYSFMDPNNLQIYSYFSFS